jgi:hypothetical protein
LHLPPELASRFAEEEAALERRFVRLNPLAQTVLARAASHQSRIIYVSDTYHTASWLREALDLSPRGQTDRRVFSSSDLAKSKASGAMFSHIRQEYPLGSKRLLHIGDHEHSDVAMPSRAGFESFHFPDATLNRYESVLSEAAWASSGLTASMAGASRMARLSCQAAGLTDDQRALTEVAAGVASPILVGYVLWILQRAQGRGIDRLYFLSRDGEVLLEIARALIGRLGISMETRYLHVSRLSCNLASTFDGDYEELSWVFRDSLGATIGEALRLLDIEWAEVVAAMADSDFFRPDEAVDAERAARLESVLLKPDLRRIITRKASRRRDLVLEYLRQEDALDGRVGFVDFGGVGSQMRALHSLVCFGGGTRPQLYLIGLDDPSDAGLRVPDAPPQWLADTECYLYDHRRNQGVRRFRGFGTCVQMFCAATHETVVGYQRRNTGVAPVFREPPAAPAHTWDLECFRRALLASVDHLVLDRDVVDPYADVRDSACEVIRLFWSEPTNAEASVWGRFPFEGAQVDSDETRLLASAYSWAHVLKGVLGGTFPDLGWRHWYEGSLSLSSPGLRVALRYAESRFREWDSVQEPRGTRLARLVRRALRRRIR